MKKAVLFIAWLLLVVVPYRAALAAEASSFESQILEVHKTIMSQATSTHEVFIPQAVASPGPEKELSPSVEMSISWYRPEELDVTEENLNIDILGVRNWKTGVIIFTGNLEATATPIFPIDFSSGYHFKGSKVDVRITRAGPVRRGYFIDGTYKITDDAKPVYLTIYLAPTDHGWETLANNISLRVNVEGYGYSIGGRIKQNKAGRLELSILGACLGAVRYFSH
ncbi:MAG: hypothetical protein Q7J73_01970 [Dehalococcoidales bacterium]|nr:hypothetical protein [Dehalococcoidales bacterium]